MLVAEDSEDDIDLLKLAFKGTIHKLHLNFVRDGDEAIHYLKGEGPYANRRLHPMPRLLLLDLKMPRLDGFEVLDWVKHEPGLRRLSTIVFTSSNSQDDINRALDLGANSYIVKPIGLEQLKTALRAIEYYWMDINASPKFP